MDKLQELSQQVWNLSEHAAIKSNPSVERYLDTVCGHLVGCQNILWNRYYNYGRIKREREQADVKPHCMILFLKGIIGLHKGNPS
jgi:hypothetical protein